MRKVPILSLVSILLVSTSCEPSPEFPANTCRIKTTSFLEGDNLIVKTLGVTVSGANKMTVRWGEEGGNGSGNTLARHPTYAPAGASGWG